MVQVEVKHIGKYGVMDSATNVNYRSLQSLAAAELEKRTVRNTQEKFKKPVALETLNGGFPIRGQKLRRGHIPKCDLLPVKMPSEKFLTKPRRRIISFMKRIGYELINHIGNDFFFSKM